METFIDRLKCEKRELDERITKLTAFLSKDDCCQVVGRESHRLLLLLRLQLDIMNSYSHVLSLRLELLEV